MLESLGWGVVNCAVLSHLGGFEKGCQAFRLLPLIRDTQPIRHALASPFFRGSSTPLCPNNAQLSRTFGIVKKGLTTWAKVARLRRRSIEEDRYE